MTLEGDADRQATYAGEVRDYLLGRISPAQRLLGPIAVRPASLAATRIGRWWLFEGKRYRALGGPLCRHWDRVGRGIERLRASHNPRWRFSVSTEGEVDWVATALHRATTLQHEFVCHSSHVGLSDAERLALEGWVRWVTREWGLHVEALGTPPGVSPALPWTAAAAPEPVSLAQLRRWAHLAKRSRWPLLREVVAESLRVYLEPESLDQLPLPATPGELFELVCIVRVLRELDPAPNAIRWLDIELGQNTIRTERLTCHYQLTISPSEVLDSNVLPSAVSVALKRHHVDLPSRIDAFVEFAEPIEGYAGMVLEMKSGGGSPGDAVFQLLCYRAALSRETPEPMVVWGLVETDEGQTQQWPEGPRHAGDLWLFSPASRIQEGMGRIGLARGRLQVQDVRWLVASDRGAPLATGTS